MSPSLLDFLRHIEHECAFILRVSKGKTRDEIINDELLNKGIIRGIEVIGQAVKNLDDDFKLLYPNVEWKKMAGTRDMMIHHYFGIDYEILWNIVSDKIPVLHDYIQQIIAEQSAKQQP
jgi:uncharacterized protein with HEPN domain